MNHIRITETGDGRVILSADSEINPGARVHLGVAADSQMTLIGALEELRAAIKIERKITRSPSDW